MPKKVPPAFPFGERLVELRARRKLTQGQLAEMIGSSQRCISAYETVARYPPTAVVVELAKALQVSADELLGLKPVARAGRAPAEDPEVRRLWKKFQQLLQLPEKERGAVILLVTSLVGARARQTKRVEASVE